MPTKTYTREYFIAKFEAIPDCLWCTGSYGDLSVHCALGHCGRRSGRDEDSNEPRALANLFSAHGLPAVADVNDALSLSVSEMFPQPTPKGRILAALHTIPAGASVTIELVGPQFAINFT